VGLAFATGRLTAEQKALKDRGIDNMLTEARDGTAETDAEHLKR
jgi:hypothetical protein